MIRSRNTFRRRAAVIEPAFVMRIDTTKAGSASDKMIIPTLGAGYDCTVEWGDGTTTAHSGTAPTIEHTYAAGGEYDVRITGDFPRIYFNNTGDRLKVLRTHLGDGTQTAIAWGANWENAWWGCGNNAEVTGVMPSNVTNLVAAWRNNNLTQWTIAISSNAASLRIAWANNNLTQWTIAIPDSVANLLGAWQNNNLTEWTVAIPSSVTNLESAWRNNILTEWTVAIPNSATNLARTWENNSLTSWTVAIPSSVTNCDRAWRDNGNMSIDPTFLNAAVNVSNFTNAFNGCTIPTAEYSQLLANLEATNTQNNVAFHGGDSKYNADPGEIARDILTAAPRNWTITDGGLET